MATTKQIKGKHGENLVVKYCSCPKCKRKNTLKKLPVNFKCSDIICDFCGFLAQVKTTSLADINITPSKILGAAWKPQKERMDSGIYFPLYIVLLSKVEQKNFTINYLSADQQISEMFIPRKPLSKKAKRAGWQGFYYSFTEIDKNKIVRIVDHF